MVVPHSNQPADEGEETYICRVVEMFEGFDKKPYVCAQWFYPRIRFFSLVRDGDPMSVEKLKQKTTKKKMMMMILVKKNSEG